MKYMLLIYSEEGAYTDAEREQCMAEVTEIVQDLQTKGQYLGASPLHPVSTATSIRIRDGKRVVTDGPFAETREHLGGFFLLDVKNLDEAIAITSRLPMAKKGTIEIRPVMEVANVPVLSAQR